MTDVLVLPGRFFGPAAPVTWYPSVVAQRRGAEVHRVEWPDGAPISTAPGVVEWVAAVAEPALDELAEPGLVIGKSLGSLAAGVAADRALPAIWLTPLLASPDVVAAVERSEAPVLLVGGTLDPAWDGDVARRLTPHVLEIEDADHGLVVPGPVRSTVAVQEEVVDAVEAFLDQIGWPSDVP